MTDPVSTKPKPAVRALSRWRLVALISLGLNLFLMGAYVGGVFRRGPDERSPRTRPFTARDAERALGPGVQPLVREIEEAHRADTEMAFDRLRGAADQATAAMRAEPFDRGKLDQALLEVRAANDALQSSFHGGFAVLVERLTPEQRATLANAQRRFGHKERRRRP